MYRREVREYRLKIWEFGRSLSHKGLTRHHSLIIIYVSFWVVNTESILTLLFNQEIKCVTPDLVLQLNHGAGYTPCSVISVQLIQTMQIINSRYKQCSLSSEDITIFDKDGVAILIESDEE